jgi:hypothetical protein
MFAGFHLRRLHVGLALELLGWTTRSFNSIFPTRFETSSFFVSSLIITMDLPYLRIQPCPELSVNRDTRSLKHTTDLSSTI